MTDERMGDALWDALDRVPRGGGVIFRHYGLDLPARRALYLRVMRVARRRQLILIAAGSDRLGPLCAGIHGRFPKRAQGIRSWPTHNMREVVAARRACADMILISPVFPTRSHPEKQALGLMRAAVLARYTMIPAIALGGVEQNRMRWLKSAGFHGWAGIDAWL